MSNRVEELMDRVLDDLGKLVSEWNRRDEARQRYIERKTDRMSNSGAAMQLVASSSGFGLATAQCGQDILNFITRSIRNLQRAKESDATRITCRVHVEPLADLIKRAIAEGDLRTPETSEPEDLIGNALYLLQLCQQDLNMGRRSIIWARAKQAKEACEALETMFSPGKTNKKGAGRK